jgi:hypothetical protein
VRPTSVWVEMRGGARGVLKCAEVGVLEMVQGREEEPSVALAAPPAPPALAALAPAPAAVLPAHSKSFCSISTVHECSV